jgi:cell division protein FtsW (lipid II flippase)
MNSVWKGRMTGEDLGFDAVLLLIVATLLGMGLITVASTTWGVSYVSSGTQSVWTLFLRQLGWAVLGIVALAVMYVVDYRIFLRVKGLVVVVALVTVAALVAVVFLRGESITRVGLIGNSVQPSELAKFVTIIYLSVWLVSKADVLHDFKLGVIPYAALIALFSGLIAIEPDYSAAVTVVLLGFAMFYFGGGKIQNVASAASCWRWCSARSALRIIWPAGATSARRTCTSARPSRPFPPAGSSGSGRGPAASSISRSRRRTPTASSP